MLFQSDDLKSAQSATDLLQKLAIVLPILTLLLFAAAIVLSRSRRKTVLHAGLGFAVGMLVILTAFNVGRSFYLDAVTNAHADARCRGRRLRPDPQLPPALGAHRVRVGIIVAIGAWLAGPSSTAVRIRSLGPWGRGPPARDRRASRAGSPALAPGSGS